MTTAAHRRDRAVNALALDAALQGLTDTGLEALGAELVNQHAAAQGPALKVWEAIIAAVLAERRRRLMETDSLEAAYDGNVGAFLGDATGLSDEEFAGWTAEHAGPDEPSAA